MRLSPTSLFGVCAATCLLLLSTSPLRAQQPCAAAAPCAEAKSDPAAAPEIPDAPDIAPAQATAVNGTVTDTNGDIVPGATVTLDGGSAADRQTVTSNDSGFFEFKGLKASVPYHVTITAPGFIAWTSPAINLTSGQFFTLTGIQIQLAGGVSSVTVYSSTEQIATQQVQIEEQQRVLGIIPNFYVVYDAKSAVPMTAKLKFKMALRVSYDPISFLGAAFLGGVNQAANTPDYPQGWLGYGQRVGAVYADGFTDIMFGGAILPSLLHQDPRYFYQGTGTIKSRTLHALANPFICRGDNGKNQINYSSMGGDLISASISNAYYPKSNRGVGFVFTGFAIDTAEREASSVIQEFVIRKLTPSAKHQN